MTTDWNFEAMLLFLRDDLMSPVCAVLGDLTTVIDSVLHLAQSSSTKKEFRSGVCTSMHAYEH